jgi:hypothetical protein
MTLGSASVLARTSAHQIARGATNHRAASNRRITVARPPRCRQPSGNLFPSQRDAARTVALPESGVPKRTFSIAQRGETALTPCLKAGASAPEKW